MLKTNCAYCGVANQLANEICIVCGGELRLKSTFGFQDQPHEWQPLVDPDQVVPGIRAFGFDTVIRDTISIFTKNLWLITKIVVVIVTPLQIFRALNFSNTSDNWEVTVWSFLLGAAAEVLMAPALIYALMKVLETGQTPGVHESYRWGMNKLVKLAVCAAIAGVLTGLGYALCIIPGIIASLAFVVVYPVAILERGSVSEVFARSMELTRGNRLQIFAASIVLGLIVGIPSVVIGSAIGSVAGLSWFWPLVVVASIAGDILGQSLTVMSLVIYLGLPRNVKISGHSVLSLK